MKSNRLVALFCATAMLASFTACDSKKSGEDKSSSVATGSSAEVTEKQESEIKTETSEEQESESKTETSKEEENTASDEEENTASDEGENTASDTETEAPEEDKPAENLVDGMRPEFKEALDSYEDFFDEYCDFMKKFNESPDDLSLLGEYTEYLTKYSETMEKMGELDDGEMNDVERKYYLEVINRINEKLLDVAL